ncbi:hypothetical protein BV22DRAFT_134394 [Leucogyrophana mollusca]|uniref:Uncharacterized protein n=1 Tax=Leucogyrophana mollusca TaxID=85980 RepID=A0ACB8BUJ9_9AGAM|nr:hypothetical protein BV22DRAFT_134394 [Leucogyrophana mollusca]
MWRWRRKAGTRVQTLSMYASKLQYEAKANARGACIWCQMTVKHSFFSDMCRAAETRGRSYVARITHPVGVSLKDGGAEKRKTERRGSQETSYDPISALNLDPSLSFLSVGPLGIADMSGGRNNRPAEPKPTDAQFGNDSIHTVNGRQPQGRS